MATIVSKSSQLMEDVLEHGSGRGELKGPCGIAIDSSDVVYFIECDNYHVSVFTVSFLLILSLSLPSLLHSVPLSFSCSFIFCQVCSSTSLPLSPLLFHLQ